MKNLIRKIFFGDAVIREYSTVTVDEEIKEKVYLKSGENYVDISRQQFLLCLEPVVFGIWLDGKKFPVNEDINFKMHFKTFAGKGFAKEKTLAIIDLVFFDMIKKDDKVLLLLKLVNTKIFHTNWLKTHLLYDRYYKKPEFSFNKLKSFAAAYSFPRKVRIVSFKEENYFNIFPMDLLGDLKENYVFGLRHTNVTLSKIIEAKKIVVSEVSYEYKDVIYQLGKHHGSTPPTLDSLPFKTERSEKFGFYIPEWIFSYKEIEIVKTINLGSHMLMWGKVIHEKKLKEPTDNLFHIHFLLYLYQMKVRDTYRLV